MPFLPPPHFQPPFRQLVILWSPGSPFFQIEAILHLVKKKRKKARSREELDRGGWDRKKPPQPPLSSAGIWYLVFPWSDLARRGVGSSFALLSLSPCRGRPERRAREVSPSWLPPPPQKTNGGRAPVGRPDQWEGRGRTARCQWNARLSQSKGLLVAKAFLGGKVGGKEGEPRYSKDSFSNYWQLQDPPSSSQ